MHPSLKYIGLFLIPMLTACASMQITSDYDPAINLSGFKTYNWMSVTQKETGDPRLDNPILDSRIRKAVENQLAEQGYERRTTGIPDFWISYHAAVRTKMQIRGMNTSYGYRSGWGWDPIDYQLHTHEYEEGTLILDIVAPIHVNYFGGVRPKQK